MKKNIFLLTIITIIISGCVKDDICIEPITPKLVIRLYNSTDTLKVKQLADFTAWAQDKDSLYSKTATDSIVLPLNVNANETYYRLASGQTIDSLHIAYERKDVFVSRSCGYKTVFEKVTITKASSNWIKAIKLKDSIIDHENSAHISIFH